MSNCDPAKVGRPTRAEQLGAVALATADPHRLVDILTGSADREDALERLREAYTVSADCARVILDNPFSLLVQSRQVELAQDLEANSL